MQNSLIKELTSDIVSRLEAFKKCTNDQDKKSLYLDPVNKDVFGSDELIFKIFDAMKVSGALFSKLSQHADRSLQILDPQHNLVDQMISFDRNDRADSASLKLNSIPVIVHNQNHFDILMPEK